MEQSSRKSRREIMNANDARVRRPAEFEEMLTELKRLGIFPDFAHALIFAAALGFRRGHRKPFTKTSDPIRIGVFNGQFDETIVNLIAIKETGDPRIMGELREAERIKCFEEYASGGLDTMKREILDTRLDWREGLLALVQQEEEENPILDNITKLADD